MSKISEKYLIQFDMFFLYEKWKKIKGDEKICDQSKDFYKRNKETLMKIYSNIYLSEVSLIFSKIIIFHLFRKPKNVQFV